MYRLKNQYKQTGSVIKIASDGYFYEALDWKEPKKIFTCSMSDFFIDEADGWREDAWNVIRKTPQHQWQILTKRPERIQECLPGDWGEGWDNVWLGVSVENQQSLQRAATLAEIPAKIRFISAEPLLEQVNFLAEIYGKRVIDDFDWIILGGESGNEFGNYRYRPLQMEWLEKINADLKQNTTISVFNKQLGTYLAKKMGLKDRHGGEIEEWPEHLRIREFPN
jgi:protein gp37